MSDGRRPGEGGPLSDHWRLHARQWQHVGPPLRPSPEDVGEVERWAAAQALARRAPPRVLLCGVTPEIATSRWPQGTQLVAVDRNAEMISDVWPGGPESSVVRGEWLSMPLAAGAFDLVAADGCMIHFSFPMGQREFLTALRRVLAPGGLAIVRAFVTPEAPETAAVMAAELRTGRIGSVHALKWRLAMSLQSSPEVGVRLADVFDAYERLGPLPPELASRPGFSPLACATLEAYRGQSRTYAFPSLAGLRRILGPHFVERAIHVPQYELGERCPTLVLEAT